MYTHLSHELHIRKYIYIHKQGPSDAHLYQHAMYTHLSHELHIRKYIYIHKQGPSHGNHYEHDMFIHLSHELHIRKYIYIHIGTFTWPHLPAIHLSHELQIRIYIYIHTGTFTWPHLPARNYPMCYKGQFVEGRPTKGCSYVYFGFFCFGLYIMHNAHARRAIALHSFIYVFLK